MEVVIKQNEQELERLEGVVDRCLDGINKLSLEGAQALRKIRDERLYEKVRGEANFETYVRERFGMARRRAYQMIDYVGVIENVNNCSQNGSIPTTESQARPLARLEPEKQRQAWKQAVETAPEGKVTAAHVYKIVKGMSEPKEPKQKPAIELKPTIPEHALYFAQIAISQLERISSDDPTRIKAFDMVQEWINKNRKGSTQR